MKDKIVQDSIHGTIRLPDYIVNIIDQPEFQRLRFIHQLGLTNFVYPCATHTRFEHSIGTYYLASQWCNYFCEKIPNCLTLKDRQIIELAALLHDIGHGPFSHFWDNYVVNRLVDPTLRKTHEQIGVDIICNELAKPNRKVFPNTFDEHDIATLADVILGKIVSNTAFEFDTDKCDYLMRDSRNCIGEKYPLQMERFFRFIDFSKVKTDGHSYLKMVIPRKEYVNVVAVFHQRHKLHRIVYQHRAVRAIDEMVYDALEAADHKYHFSQTACDYNVLLQYTDGLLWQLYLEDTPVVSRLLRRQLYRCLKVFSSDRTVDLEILKREMTSDEELQDIRPADFRVTESYFDYAGKTANPLSSATVVDEDGVATSLSSILTLNGKPEFEIRLYLTALNYPAYRIKLLRQSFQRTCERLTNRNGCQPGS